MAPSSSTQRSSKRYPCQRRGSANAERIAALQRYRSPSTGNGVASSVLVLLLAFVCAGCGTGQGGGTITGGSTLVTVVVSGTANGQISQFNLFLNSLTLIARSGKKVSVLPSPQDIEFIHLGGRPEPLAAVSVPQDTYTSASATVGLAQFGCVYWDASKSPSGIVTSYVDYGYTPDSQVTVNMPSAITVDGSAMGLSLNLAVSTSANYDDCRYGSAPIAQAITPTFILTSFQLSAAPMISGFANLEGVLASVAPASNEFTVTAADGAGWETTASGNEISSPGLPWRMQADSATSLQGFAGLGALAVGEPLDITATLQADGSLRCSRIAVLDSDPTDLTVTSGPLLEVVSWQPTVLLLARQQQGFLVDHAQAPYNPSGASGFGYSSAEFAVSGQSGNLQSLPFTPRFDATTMVSGQNVVITSHTASGGDPTQASTVTLMPQTINGTVSAVNPSGSFTVYTVELAPYDLFPTLAFSNSFQKSPLTSPTTVYVYADTNTSMLNAQPITVGNLLRFTGLVFNDKGTLRMDCSQIMDGVAK